MKAITEVHLRTQGAAAKAVNVALTAATGSSAPISTGTNLVGGTVPSTEDACSSNLLCNWRKRVLPTATEVACTATAISTGCIRKSGPRYAGHTPN